MRNQSTIYNIITNLLVQIFLGISGFVIPKYVIETYGSAVNGMIGSIGQFLIYAGLVELGVGNAVIVALYKPLAYSEQNNINDILAQAKRKYCVSGVLYSLITCIIAFLYPVIVGMQFKYSYVFFLTFLLAVYGAIDYFFIGKYKVLLLADQKMYIINIIKCVMTCLLTVGSVFLLSHQFSLLLVKGLAVLIHLWEAYLIKRYVEKHYAYIDFHSNNRKEFPQQNSALVHQLCATVVYNTDLLILTLFLKPVSTLKEISVYMVYLMAKTMLSNIVSALTNGMSASFGELFAKQKSDFISREFKKYEFLYFIVLFTCYSCFISLILSFVSCYTKNITDVQYVRLRIGVLFGVTGLIAQIKDASGVIINAAGHYSQSRKFAIAEAVTNIILSLLLVKPLGMEGVLIGTVIAHLVMDVGMIVYASQNLVKGSVKFTVRRVVRNLAIMIMLCVIEITFFEIVNDWFSWIFLTIKIVLINSFVIVIVNGMCEFKTLKESIKILICKEKLNL